jgi:mRNA interferase MazF
VKSGDIVLIPFPFSEITNVKVRPAVVLFETSDKYKDITVCAISSVVAHQISKSEIILKASPVNGLRVTSVIKVDRIVTIKRNKVIATLGKLTTTEKKILKQTFALLINQLI